MSPSMQVKSISLAILAAFGGAVQAAVTVVPSAVVVTPTATGVTFNFTSLTLAGFEFSQLAGDLAGPIYGTLTAVSVDATLDASVDYTYGDDLTVYVDPLPLSSGGLLQVGGFSNLGAAERHAWRNGASSAPGTTVVDSWDLTTPLTFSGAVSDPAIWLGNGYGASGTEGTWTGSITLVGLSLSAPVPEPQSWAMFAAGGLGLMAWLARRRRQGT